MLTAIFGNIITLTIKGNTIYVLHRFQLFVSKIASFDFQSILNHWTKVLQDMFWVFTVEFSMEDYSADYITVNT